MSDLEALLRWYLALSLVAVACAPLLLWLLRSIGSAAYGVLRPLGLVVLTALVWWPAALAGLPFTRWTLLIGVILIGALGWGIRWRAIRDEVQRSWRVLLGFEAAWLAVFALYALFRAYYPDIINTEKPMEMALLSSVSRSADVPAPDPWFAGEHINYYYFGYQQFASLVRLSGVEVGVAFNLALAATFASCATAAAAAGLGLSRIARMPATGRVLVTLLAPILLLLAGNLETAHRLVDDPRATVEAGWWDGVGWQASRVVVDNNIFSPGDQRETINEFPAFSFVLADLHPHVISLPLLASVVVVAIALARIERRRPLLLLFAGGFAGLLYASNSWDAPLAALLLAGGAIWGCRAWRERGIAVGSVALGALITAVPFLLHFDAPLGAAAIDAPQWMLDMPLLGRLIRTFGIVTWQPSSVAELLTVHGHWVAIAVVWSVPFLLRDDTLRQHIQQRRELVIAALLLLLAIAVVWMPAVVVLGLPLAAAAWIAWRTQDTARSMTALLLVVGFGLALVPEVVYIRDVFGDRMNTVFKLYTQSWLVLSLAVACIAVDAVRTWEPRWRPLIAAGVVAVIVSSLTYTPLSAWDWTNGFETRYGLNGAAYLHRTAPTDAAGITWLRDNAEAGDTIVEGPGCSYRNAWGAPTSRMAIFTGIPTYIGWVGHESQWRLSTPGLADLLDARVAEAQAILNGNVGPDATNVDFVILGILERTGSPECAASGPVAEDADGKLLAAGWSVAFTDEQLTIYARTR